MLDLIDKSVVEHLFDPTIDEFIATRHLSPQSYHEEWANRWIG
jgi:hypothetical protein